MNLYSNDASFPGIKPRFVRRCPRGCRLIAFGNYSQFVYAMMSLTWKESRMQTCWRQHESAYHVGGIIDLTNMTRGKICKEIHQKYYNLSYLVTWQSFLLLITIAKHAMIVPISFTILFYDNITIRVRFIP